MQVLERLPRATPEALTAFVAAFKRGGNDKKQRDAIKELLRTAGAHALGWPGTVPLPGGHCVLAWAMPQA